jgi:aminocarboxymuconate-semialdehyde decarboxylase
VAIVDGLARRTVRPTVTTNERGQRVLNAMTASTIMSAGYTDLEARLSYIDATGVDTQLLTFPGALGVDVMPIPEALPIVRDYNDHLAAICRDSGGRFVGLGGLPLDDMAESAAEMRRVRGNLCMPRAILPGNYFLTTAAAEMLGPVLAAADEAGALLMIHPGLIAGELPPASYADNSILRASAINLQALLLHMTLTVIVSGLLDAYPNVTFHVVNLGGTLPFILERIDAIAASRKLPAPVTVDHLHRLVYDCASLGPRALELAVQTIGADRIMMGTDYPIFEPYAVSDTVRRARIADTAKASVLTETAKSVLAMYT